MYRYRVWHDYSNANVGITQANVSVEFSSPMDFQSLVQSINMRGLTLPDNSAIGSAYWIPTNRIIRVEYLGTIDT